MANKRAISAGIVSADTASARKATAAAAKADKAPRRTTADKIFGRGTAGAPDKSVGRSTGKNAETSSDKIDKTVAGASRKRKAPATSVGAPTTKGRKPAGSARAAQDTKAADRTKGTKSARGARNAGRGANRVQDTKPATAAAAPGPSTGRKALTVALRAIALLIFAVCAAIVLKLTLTPSPASVGIAHTNLKPGATIRLYLNQPSVRLALLQIGGNILIGAPFGVLLPAITPRFRGLLRVVLTTAVCVTLIELTQHFFIEGRSFDVDDIILAVVGAALAYILFGRTLALKLHPTHRHWWQRRLDAFRGRRRV